MLKSFVENNKELINDFREAINKALIFTKENDSKTIAKVLLKQFPDTSLNELTTIVNRYKEADSWLDSTFIEKEFLLTYKI